MSFWQKLRPSWWDKKYTSLDLFKDIYGSRESNSGVTVGTSEALEVSVVLACCKVIAEGVAQVPFKVFNDDGGKTQEKAHPLYRVLYRKPNPWQTSFEFRETLIFHTALTGNAFVFINRAGPGKNIVELIPIEPGRVQVTQQADYTLTYKVTGKSGVSQDFRQEDIWHLRGPSWNTWMGMDTIGLARESIGLALATERTHSDFHKNGAQSSGMVAIDKPLETDQYERLQKWVIKEIGEPGTKFKPLIMDNGAKWTPFQMSGVDAQHLDTRKFQVEEICRAFRVQPIMVMQADKAATFSSSEQMFLNHVVHTLAPWYERIEQSADVNLLTLEEQDAGYYTKFNPTALLRGASKDRAEFYAKALGSGGSGAYMEVNEIRALEDLPPVEWGKGEPQGQTGQPATEDKPADDEEQGQDDG